MTIDSTNGQDSRIHYLYCITNRINNKKYIGQSVDPAARWYAHKNDATKDNPTMVISKAIKKYGNDAFEFEVIAGCQSWENANETETLLVSQYSSLVPNGYNVALGGYNAPKTEVWKQSMRDWHASMSNEEKEARSKILSEATLRQISEKGHPSAGKKRTDEQKARMSAAQQALDKEAIYTEEVRQHMSEAHIGIKDSEETKQKKSESAKEAWEKRIDYSRKCSFSDCEVSGKAKYKIIDGVRYCTKHGQRVAYHKRTDRLNP